MRNTTSMMVGLGLVMFAGCAEDAEPVSTEPAPTTSTARLALTADLLGGTDVGGMRFVVTEADCAGAAAPNAQTWEKTTDLEDMYLPGGIPLFEQEPYDAQSTHIFADQYFLLPAGCFNVAATPLDAQDQASSDCYAAHQNGVEVTDGLTTEITLISQCQGPARGGLDVIATINHPPVIDDLAFEPSKFVATCWGVEVCVTARDPDGDPMEFVWTQSGGGALVSGPTVNSTTLSPDGTVTQCATIQTGDVDSYQFEVDVYDLAYDEQGQIARIEDLLSAQGDPHDSHDSMQFPVHAGIDCQVAARTVVMLLALSNNPGPSAHQAKKLIRNAINWVNPTKNADPRILLVLDDETHGEHPAELAYLQARFGAAGFTNVTTITEPSTGLLPGDVTASDIVWFSNPGHPMDDLSTYNTLMDYRTLGGGLVLQGDDMGWFQGNALSMTPFTNLTFLNNGTTTCGELTDNNLGQNYRVTFGVTPHPLIAGLEGASFLYGNDIDHTVAIDSTQVFATARSASPGCPFRVPVLIGIEP